MEPGPLFEPPISTAHVETSGGTNDPNKLNRQQVVFVCCRAKYVDVGVKVQLPATKNMKKHL